MNNYLEELKNFDYTKLESYEFKEVDVREEIVVPLLKALGYNYKGNFKIVREKKLTHPFNVVGSKKYSINIFPDYILEYSGKCFCVIEVKAPNKSLSKEEYIGQAYSYAIHREVQANFYALCNGKRFVLYDTSLYKPILEFNLEDIEKYFDYLNKFIGTNCIEKNQINSKNNIVKDLGIHFKMLSANNAETKFIMHNVIVDNIMRINNETYCITVNALLEDEEYCASFDFDYEKFLQLKPYLKQCEFEMLNQKFEGKFISIDLEHKIKTKIECELGKEIFENKNEYYIPLQVCKFVPLGIY